MSEAVAGFDWNDGNRDKCVKHGVTVEEIESAFRGGTLRVFPDPAHSATETRYLGIGLVPLAGTCLWLSPTQKLRSSDSSGLSVPVLCMRRKSNTMKRKVRTLAKLPRLKTDREAEQFVSDSDLTRYNLAALKATQFEFAAKEARINMRLPGELLNAVKRAARQRGVPYQRFIRQTLERAIKE